MKYTATTIQNTDRILREPYLQSCQYKIINRILNCEEKLLKWKPTPDDNCTYCGLIDHIEHHLFV